MADEFQDKTEEPTPKKLADARKKGQVARSQDLSSSVLLLVVIFSFLFFGSYMYEKVAGLFRGCFMNLSYDYSDTQAVVFWMGQGMKYLSLAMAPLAVAAVTAGFLGNVFQIGWLMTGYPLIPKWKNLNIFDPSNYKKFFNIQAVMRLFFGLAKIAVVGIVCFLIVSAHLDELSNLMHGQPWDIFVFVLQQGMLMGLAIAIILIVLGLADFAFQKWKYTKDMRMTKTEVKDERRQTEGDVQVKTKLRSMMQAFAQSRMKEAVPKADVVIANPVHFAIAIKYDPEDVPAPICVAKGARKMAQAIKAIAREHEVPIVENPPLAQALYRAVEVGSLIPPDFYHAVAEVLAYVYSLNEQMGRKVPKGLRRGLGEPAGATPSGAE